jgi:hypothetical protein
MDAKMSNFIKILPMGPELFYADGRTGRYKEATSRFSQFAKALKNRKSWRDFDFVGLDTPHNFATLTIKVSSFWPYSQEFWLTMTNTEAPCFVTAYTI